MTCCNQPRTSRFCPDCGRRLAEGPLVALLDYCQGRARAYEAMAKRWQGEGFDQSSDGEHARKWRHWAEALAGFLAAHPEAMEDAA